MQRIVKQSKTLLLLLAFVLVFSPLSALADAGKKQSVTYVSLGDSLAAGMLSDGSVSDDYNGYAGYIKSDLESTGYEVDLKNYGFSGFTSKQVLDGLHEVKELADADIITISAGANDVLAGLDAAYLDYLNPDKVDALIQATEEAVAAAVITSNNALNTIDEATEPVSEAMTAVLEGQQVVGVAMNAVAPFVDILPENIKAVLTAIDEDIEEAADSVDEANNELMNAKVVFFSNPAEAVSALEKLGNNLDKTEQKLKSVVTNVGEIETFIEETLLPISEEIKVAVLNVKVKANQAVIDTGNAADTIQNAKVSVIIAVEALNTAQEAKEFAVKVEAKIEELLKAIDAIPGKIQAVGVNMATILGKIKAVNPTAKIYVMGYYNALPYLSPEIQQSMTLRFLEGLNSTIEGVSKLAGATYVPTFELFQGKYGTFLPNPKNIHPSDDGYRVLASGFMGEIIKSFPNFAGPITPGDKEIHIGEKVNVSAGEQILINGTDVSLLLPEDLPEGTTLTVTPTSDDALANAKGLKAVGNVLNFTFDFPEGFEDYEGTFTLVMGYAADSPDDVDIYHFEDGKWASKNGEVDEESHEISLIVKSFSDYGVFAKEEIKEDPPAVEEPSDDDKTPPVTKDPTKGSDKDNKSDGKKTTTNGAKLPKTATNNYALLLLGTILLVSGSVSLIFMRKKRLISHEI